MGKKVNSARGALFAAALVVGSAGAKEPADYINPIIGASTSADAAGVLHGLGKTFPGAATPFGLVQLSPDTITGGDNGSGYSWQHNTIEGFSFVHMSGIGWYGDFGNFLVMPTTGELKTASGREDAPELGYRSRFSHANETATAGYYRVYLDDYKVNAELTAAPHSGILRFTYDGDGVRRVQIDLARRIGGTAETQSMTLDENGAISGRMVCTQDCGGWGDGDGKSNYTVYYYCKFSESLEKFGAWSADIPDGAPRKRNDVTSPARQKIFAQAKVLEGCRELEGKHIGFYAEFPAETEQVLVKCGISFVSVDGAKNNLETEIPDWDFDKVHAGARQLWNDACAKVSVKGGTETQKEILYTALYHTMIDPRSASDADGTYPGADGKSHKSERFVYRTIFSGWDVFRSQFPLQTIINPELVNDEINSLLQMSVLSGKGYLPRWEIMNSYSGCMLGNPAVPVIVDAYQKGIRGYDAALAFKACRMSVEEFTNQPLGYVPGDISRTLEYAYTDWCTGRFAELLDKPRAEKKYKDRAQDYRNIYDEQVGWFRGKRADGTWNDWQGKTVHGQGCTESNPFQQGWFVPQDVYGLIDLLGKDRFLAELNEMFDKAPDKFTWNDYYNHPNEPVHHVPFLFVYAGEGWLTQKWSRTVCENAYGTGWDGLCGNEDVGQMSAWYVLAATGIHPVCPGDGIYIITSPLFDKITLKLDRKYADGESFTITAKDNSPENKYISSLKLNGKPLDRLWIKHSEIAAGGELEMQMSAKPNKQLGKDNLPPSNY